MSATTQPDPDLPPLPEGGHPAVRGVALLVRFLLEIVLLVAVGRCVLDVTGGRWWGWFAAVGAAGLVGAAWAAWLSPRAPYRPGEPARVGIEAVLFGGAGAALWALGHPGWGAVLAGAWVVDRVVLAVVRPVR